MEEFRKIAIYFTCLLLINCAGSAQHDVVSAHKAGDMDMTCKELDSEIVRAQVIIDGVEKDKSGMSGADILDGLLWFPFNLIAKSQNYKNALNSADRRIERVEKLKVDKGCESRSEEIKAKTEDLTQQLLNLNQLYKDGGLTKSEYTKAKRKLLGGDD
tara:strand:- start:39 stop:512 length:474 start_codon:yes stop_codon:yes gene_type:complete